MASSYEDKGDDIYSDETGDVLLSKKQIEVVRLDELQLNREFCNIAGDLAYWNGIYADAFERFLLEKHELKVTEAKLWLKYRSETSEVKPRVSDTEIKSMMHSHPDWISANLRRIQAEAEAKRAGGFAESVKAKKDGLQSLGAKVREEMRGDPTVREQHREAQEYDRDDDD
jgi:hypothetical protein